MIVERFVAWIGNAGEGDRADAASALAHLWLAGELDPGEQDAAEAAMTTLLDDPSPLVRAALAAELACEPSAPRHIVMGLAADLAAVALPVLARSPVFLDAELIDLVATGTCEHQIAIACRARLSPAVAAAIAGAGAREACAGLLGNEGAVLTPAALHAIGERHGEDAEIRRILLRRKDILAATRLLLIDRLAESLRARHCRDGVSEARVDAMIAASRDKAIIVHASRSDEQELPEIVAALVAAERMNAAFLLRAVCMGNIALFSAALGHLAEQPVRRVETVLAQSRRSAFRAIYLKAGLPESAFEVFADALDLWRAYLEKPAQTAGIHLPYLVTRDLLSTYRGNGDIELDRLLVLLRRLAGEAARENARGQVGRIALELRERERLLLEAPVEQEDDLLDRFPVIDVPSEVLTAFAVHFAEALVELEEESPVEPVADGDAIGAPEELAEPQAMSVLENGVVLGEAANDDLAAACREPYAPRARRLDIVAALGWRRAA